MKMFIFFQLFLALFTFSSVLGAMPGLSLVGQGSTYYMGFIKVYDARLYGDTTYSSDSILKNQSSTCLSLDYAVAIKAEDLIKSAEKILSKQHDKKILDAFSKEIFTIHNAYEDVEAGDNYTLCYSAEKQETTLVYNSSEVAAIKNEDFGAIYFGIWLGDNNVIDNKLKKQLLEQR